MVPRWRNPRIHTGRAGLVRNAGYCVVVAGGAGGRRVLTRLLSQRTPGPAQGNPPTARVMVLPRRSNDGTPARHDLREGAGVVVCLGTSVLTC